MTKKEIRELRPCPFCGSGNIVEDRKTSGHGESTAYYKCTNCYAAGPNDYYSIDIFKSWNTRIAP